MSRHFFILTVFLAGTSGWAAAPCIPRETLSIETDMRCVESGISIGIMEEEGAKVACMSSKEVQNRCGADGRLVRLRAYQAWLKKEKAFEKKCDAKGGTFSYDDIGFVEPQDESYCGQAIPEVKSNMFEEYLCNYRSICPPVTLVCEQACRETPVPNHIDFSPHKRHKR